MWATVSGLDGGVVVPLASYGSYLGSDGVSLFVVRRIRLTGKLSHRPSDWTDSRSEVALQRWKRAPSESQQFFNNVLIPNIKFCVIFLIWRVRFNFKNEMENLTC